MDTGQVIVCWDFYCPKMAALEKKKRKKPKTKYITGAGKQKIVLSARANVTVECHWACDDRKKVYQGLDNIHIQLMIINRHTFLL